MDAAGSVCLGLSWHSPSRCTPSSLIHDRAGPLADLLEVLHPRQVGRRYGCVRILAKDLQEVPHATFVPTD